LGRDRAGAPGLGGDVRGRAARSRKLGSGHVGTISITVRVCRISWNGMKPQFQRVLTR